MIELVAYVLAGTAIGYAWGRSGGPDEWLVREHLAVQMKLAGTIETAEQLRGRVAELERALDASEKALRSYQYGNASTELAEEIADFARETLGRSR